MINTVSNSSFAEARHHQKRLLMGIPLLVACPAALEASEACQEELIPSTSAQMVPEADSSSATQIASFLSSYGAVVLVEVSVEMIWMIFSRNLVVVEVEVAAAGRLGLGLGLSR
jgi:hypothetical protein